MNSMQPIWNAVLSSDNTNAASLTVKLWSCGRMLDGSPARCAICASAALLVCASMKREIGTSAIFSASCMPIWSRS